MRFWDTSAVVPLCVAETTTDALLELVRSDPAIVVWWATRLEVNAALARRVREGAFDAQAEREAKQLLVTLDAAWVEVVAHEQLRLRTERLLSLHPLRAADALQLAAALVWCGERTASEAFVCVDERLRSAAAREGFRVLPTEPAG